MLSARVCEEVPRLGGREEQRAREEGWVREEGRVRSTSELG